MRMKTLTLEQNTCCNKGKISKGTVWALEWRIALTCVRLYGSIFSPRSTIVSTHALSRPGRRVIRSSVCLIKELSASRRGFVKVIYLLTLLWSLEDGLFAIVSCCAWRSNWPKYCMSDQEASSMLSAYHILLGHFPPYQGVPLVFREDWHRCEIHQLPETSKLYWAVGLIS